MGSKGGGGGTNWIDYKIQNEKMELEKANKAAADQAAFAKAQADATARTNSFNTGLENVRSSAKRMVEGRGLNYADYEGDVEQAIARANQNVSADEINPGKYFTDDIITAALGRRRDDERTRYTNQVAQRYAPGFENQYFSDASDDPFIEQALGAQRNNAVGFLNRAKSRGQLDDTGFQAAMTRLGEMDTTARSTAQSLGSAVLQGNRTRLTDIANNAKSAAGQYELGQAFDPSTYDTRFNETLTGLQSRLPGDVLGALEGQKFYDTGDLILRAGSASGSTNPLAESPEALAAAEKRRNLPRGIGQGGGTF
jgi:hypothetical protein